MGDKNTNFFHHFANGRKISNTIWTIDRMDGSKVFSFEYITGEGTLHFESLFKSNSRANIDMILRVVGLLPRFISPKENKKLMEEITMEELEKIIHSF